LKLSSTSLSALTPGSTAWRQIFGKKRKGRLLEIHRGRVRRGGENNFVQLGGAVACPKKKGRGTGRQREKIRGIRGEVHHLRKGRNFAGDEC